MQEMKNELSFLIFILENFNHFAGKNELNMYYVFQKSVDFMIEVCIIKISKTWRNSNYYIKKRG